MRATASEALRFATSALTRTPTQLRRCEVSERHEYRKRGVHRDSAGYRAGLEKAQRKELEKREQSFLATQQDPSQAFSAEAGARFLRIWQYERPGFGTGG